MVDKLASVRKKINEMLITNGTEEIVMQNLAEKIGVEKHNCESDNIALEKCIKCGKCVKVCRDVVGVNALSISNEGDKKNKKVTPLSFETAYSCIGCGSCAYICPVKCIEMEDIDETRTIHIWKVNLKLKRCKVCNNYFAPEAQLDYIRERAGLPDGFFDTCINCK